MAARTLTQGRAVAGDVHLNPHRPPPLGVTNQPAERLDESKRVVRAHRRVRIRVGHQFPVGGGCHQTVLVAISRGDTDSHSVTCPVVVGVGGTGEPEREVNIDDISSEPGRGLGVHPRGVQPRAAQRQPLSSADCHVPPSGQVGGGLY